MHAHHDRPRQETNKLIGITAGHCSVRGQYVLSERYTDRGVAGVVTYTADDLDIAVIEFNESWSAPCARFRGDHQWIRHRPCHSHDRMQAGAIPPATRAVSPGSPGHEHYSQLCIVEGDSAPLSSSVTASPEWSTPTTHSAASAPKPAPT